MNLNLSGFPKISVIVACRNERRYIGRCLDSIITQEYPADKIEVLIVDGMSDDGTREIIEEYAKEHKYIKIIDNLHKITPVALNAGIRNSVGEVVGIVGAHSALSSDYIATCVYFLDKTNADNVGGICKHIGNGFIGKAIALAEGCKFGLGGAQFRTATKERYVDTVFPGFLLRKAFEKYGYLNEKLVRNQDIEFNSRIRKGGGKIFLTPKIVSYYYCRSTLKDLWTQNFRNGFWNIETIKIAPGSLSFRHFIPLLFVASLLTTWIIPILWAVVMVNYFWCSLFFSIKIALVNGVKYFFAMPIIFLTLHLSYGLGSLVGIVLYASPTNKWGGLDGRQV